MLRQVRVFDLLALPVICALPLIFGACTPKPAKGSEMAEARLEASETKMAQLEERIAEMERKTGQIDGVAEGVQLLLKRIDELNAGNARPPQPKPDPNAVYSMPIDGDPFVGPKVAKVTMVKGYDFYCGYCDKVRPALTELQSIYGKDLKIVFKNFVIHDDYARLPALAACAAHKQNKFMPIFEQIWIQGIRIRQELNEDHLIAMATKIGLNMKRFKKDMHGSCEDKIKQDFENMAAVGSTGTPAFYINGRFIAGALPVQKYRRIIDQELAKANRAIKAGTKLKNYYQQEVVEAGLKSL
jgi:protein-disulfide isomerase